MTSLSLRVRCLNLLPIYNAETESGRGLVLLQSKRDLKIPPRFQALWGATVLRNAFVEGFICKKRVPRLQRFPAQ